MYYSKTMKGPHSQKNNKIVSIRGAVRIAERARRAGERVVTTNGCFDLLHLGHVHSLLHAKKCGDVLIVGINSDASVRRNKGAGRPLVPARERAEMVAALRSVDYVFIFSDETPVAWLARMRPHVHVKGSDCSLGRGRLLESDIVERGGGCVILFPHTGKHSTTALIEKIRKASQRKRKPLSK